MKLCGLHEDPFGGVGCPGCELEYLRGQIEILEAQKRKLTKCIRAAGLERHLATADPVAIAAHLWHQAFVAECAKDDIVVAQREIERMRYYGLRRTEEYWDHLTKRLNQLEEVIATGRVVK